MADEFTVEELIKEMREDREGATLAMTAVAKSLDSIHAFISKEDTAAEEAAEMQKAADEQAELVKSISDSVLAEIQKTLGKVDNGMPGLGDSDAARGSNYDGDNNGAGKGGASQVDDGETPVNVDKNIGEQQKTIQASADDKKLDEEKEMSKADDDKSDKYPNKEDEPEDVKKSVDDLRAELEKAIADTESKVEAGVQGILQKMGIVNTSGMLKPTQISDATLGLTDATEVPLTKSTSEEPQFAVEDGLADNLSYHQLRALEDNLEQGNTAGIPAEITERFQSRRVN